MYTGRPHAPPRVLQEEARARAEAEAREAAEAEQEALAERMRELEEGQEGQEALRAELAVAREEEARGKVGVLWGGVGGDDSPCFLTAYLLHLLSFHAHKHGTRSNRGRRPLRC